LRRNKIDLRSADQISTHQDYSTRTLHEKVDFSQLGLISTHI
jgi:hypothetical protein